MCCATSPGNNYFQSSLFCFLRILHHAQWRAVCGHNRYFMCNTELFKNISGGLHDRKITVAAHNNTYLWIHAAKKQEIILLYKERLCGITSILRRDIFLLCLNYAVSPAFRWKEL